MIRTTLSVRSALPRRVLGFTAIEMMVTFVLIAIGATLALPSYRDMVEKRHLTSGAEQLAAFINLHQGEAMRRNQPVTVSWSPVGDSWCVGAVVGITACDCTETSVSAPDYCAIDATRRTLDSSHFGNRDLLAALVGDRAITFDPVRGTLSDMTETMTMELQSDDQKFMLSLQVTGAGEVIICSKDDDNHHVVPGYVCSAQEEEET